MKLKLSILFIFTYFLMFHAQSRKDVNIDQNIEKLKRISEGIIIVQPTEEDMLLQQSLIDFQRLVISQHLMYINIPCGKNIRLNGICL